MKTRDIFGNILIESDDKDSDNIVDYTFTYNYEYKYDSNNRVEEAKVYKPSNDMELMSIVYYSYDPESGKIERVLEVYQGIYANSNNPDKYTYYFWEEVD